MKFIGNIILTEQLGGAYIHTVVAPGIYSTAETAQAAARAFSREIEGNYSPYTNMTYTAQPVSLEEQQHINDLRKAGKS